MQHNPVVIHEADVEIVGMERTLFLSAEIDGKPSSIKFVIESADYKTQLAGTEALSYLITSLGLNDVRDASELLGQSLPACDWERFVSMVTPKIKAVQSSLTERSSSDKDGRYVYVISAADSDVPLCKIGIASSPERRLQQLSTGSPHALRIELALYSDKASSVERAAHSYFQAHRRNGEWFSITPRQAISYLTSDMRAAA